MCRIIGMCMELIEWVMGMGVKSNRNKENARGGWYGEGDSMAVGMKAIWV